MKKLFVLVAVIASVFLIASCDSSSGGDDDDDADKVLGTGGTETGASVASQASYEVCEEVGEDFSASSRAIFSDTIIVSGPAGGSASATYSITVDPNVSGTVDITFNEYRTELEGDAAVYTIGGDLETKVESNDAKTVFTYIMDGTVTIAKDAGESGSFGVDLTMVINDDTNVWTLKGKFGGESVDLSGTN